MYINLFHSVKTLLQYVNSEDVIIFGTPPVRDEHLQNLRRLGVEVRKVKNQTESFEAFNTERHFGEKTHLCKIQDSPIIFLDCDTLIFDDITDVVSGDFDFKARPGSSMIENWEKLFENNNESKIEWMPNTGFMIFKNEIHKEIGSKWRRYISELDYSNRNGVNHREQYALSLCLSEYDLEKMNEKEHVFEWFDSIPPEGTVYHKGRVLQPNENRQYIRKIITSFLNKLK